MKPNDARYELQPMTGVKITGNGTISACTIAMFYEIRDPLVRAQALKIMTSAHSNMLAREARSIQERTE